MLGTKRRGLPQKARWDRIAAAVLTPGLAIIMTTVLAQTAIAGCDGQGHKCTRPCNSALMLCCPNDYCRKPMPCVPCPQPGRCPDDYCRKPMPCVPCPQASRCPDDYCRKPMPCLCWPPLPVKYSCGSCPPPQ
jgi:hypothetical protein